MQISITIYLFGCNKYFNGFDRYFRRIRPSFHQYFHCIKSARSRSYSGPHFSRIFPHLHSIRRDTEDLSYSEYLSVFSPNAGKYGKNVDQNNFEYGHLLRSICFHNLSHSIPLQSLQPFQTKTFTRRCSVKKVFLEISQNSQEKVFARVSFLIKLKASGLRFY